MKKTNQLTSHVIQHYRAHLLKDIINGSKLIYFVEYQTEAQPSCTNQALFWWSIFALCDVVHLIRLSYI